VLVLPRGQGKLPFGRRKAVGVLETILVAEQPDIDIAAVDLVEIHLVGPAVRGGHLLKQEGLEEAAEQRIAL
jgi:hypothetical protein